VQWAAAFADAYSAELHVVQVVIPLHPADTQHGTAEVTRARAALVENFLLTLTVMFVG